MLGTINNPYLIYTSNDFNNIRNNIGNSNNHVYYKLMNDINLSEINNWIPIGNITNPAYISIDGNNKKIFGLNINNSILDEDGDISLYGIFGCVKLNNKEYLFKNLIIESCSININSNNSYCLLCGILSTIIYDNSSEFSSNYEEELNSIINVKIKNNKINISNINSSILLVGGFSSYASSSKFSSCYFLNNKININKLNNDLITLKVSAFGSLINKCQNSVVKNNFFNINPQTEILESEINCFSTNANYYIFKNNYSLNNIIINNIDNLNSVSSGIDSSANLLYNDSINIPNFAFNYSNNKFNLLNFKNKFVDFDYIDLDSSIQNNYYYSENIINSLYADWLFIEYLKNKNNFINWDFNNVWRINSFYQNGFPHLKNEIETINFNFVSPAKNEKIKTNKKMVIQWQLKFIEK